MVAKTDLPRAGLQYSLCPGHWHMGVESPSKQVESKFDPSIPRKAKTRLISRHVCKPQKNTKDVSLQTDVYGLFLELSSCQAGSIFMKLLFVNAMSMCWVLKVLTNAQVHGTSLLPLSTWALCMLGVGAAHSGSLAVHRDSPWELLYNVLLYFLSGLGPSWAQRFLEFQGFAGLSLRVARFWDSNKVCASFVYAFSHSFVHALFWLVPAREGSPVLDHTLSFLSTLPYFSDL